MAKLLALMLAALMLAAWIGCARARAAGPDGSALLVTIKWDETGASVEKVETRDLPVPMQRGFPQLWSRFFELRDAQDNVHYAGPLVDPRATKQAKGGTPAGTTFRVLVPDLPEARRMVIVERVPSDDLDKARHVVKDETLQPAK